MEPSDVSVSFKRAVDQCRDEGYRFAESEEEYDILEQMKNRGRKINEDESIMINREEASLVLIRSDGTCEYFEFDFDL